MARTILTKFLGPTNLRGSRVKAQTYGGESVTLQWDHALNPTRNHHAAAKALADKMGWSGEWVMGETADFYVFVSLHAGVDLITGPPEAVAK